MKYIVAIAFLLVHLFNMGGYTLIFNHFEQSSDVKQEAKIERESYSESELIEVRVPVRLPYQVSTAGFERFEGEVEMNGVHYNYVKRKVQNDTLVLLCLPNKVKTEVLNARETFFSLVNDLNQASDNTSPPAPVKQFKLLALDLFFLESTQLTEMHLLMTKSFPPQAIENILPPFVEAPIKPPGAIS